MFVLLPPRHLDPLVLYSSLLCVLHAAPAFYLFRSFINVLNKLILIPRSCIPNKYDYYVIHEKVALTILMTAQVHCLSHLCPQRGEISVHYLAQDVSRVY
jgi:hypothetical protein